jgi:hypothetical protein
VVGNAAAGKAWFDGEGRCTTCHSVTGDFAGLATRIPAPVDLQQRMLFPVRRAGRGGEVTRTDVSATIRQPSGAVTSGVLVQEDDFFVTVRDGAGGIRVIRKAAGVTVETSDPLRAHRELLDRMTDAHMHDLVAYLVTLK